jgi:signal transduction histidine kinase
VQEAELSDRKLEVKVEVSDDLPTILGDSDQIKQVFFNLIKNAMEAMQPNGSLRIIARRDDDYVYLQFVDTGSGISEEESFQGFSSLLYDEKRRPRPWHDDC